MILRILSAIFIAGIMMECSSKPVTLATATRKVDEKSAEYKSRSTAPDSPPGSCFIRKKTPAVYNTVSEKVLVKPAETKTVDVPEVTETVEERIIDKEGYTYWVTNETNEIWYQEEVPTTYKIVKKQIVKSPAERKTVEIPAEYRTIDKQVVVKEESYDWQEVLCGNNATKETVKSLQDKLKSAGFSPGNTDGNLDEDTMKALNEYQSKNRLPVDKNNYINMESLKKLGVKVQPKQS
ncbi:MAG TPA: peptidoglycan-binding domain-containing protein [Leptospiraceae bacterium]|nr:peptidoglycan-binding domain-containing protein [Leptospiraceae bacterium]HMZ60761.1 peptidoglycan-binding domain-containing protein [Leptospiraceae bacterium]HNN05695.1 peptidoglycan-binding domain-containing protein [Leptospiraceae bacterium]